MSLMKWDFGKLSTSKYDTYEYTIEEAFGGILVSADTADITLTSSEDGLCRVVLYEAENRKSTVTVTDGVLTFSPTDPDMPTLPDTPIDPLPKLDTADDGKVLTAEDGVWRAKSLPDVTHPKELPTAEEADEGKVLTVKAGAAVWEAVAKEECLPELPSVTSDDNGKFLRVVNGVWQAEALATAEGVAF